MDLKQILIDIARAIVDTPDSVTVEETVNGETVVRDVDLLSYFMEGETILGAFGYVCLFGFILLFLFTAFRILRDQLSFYEKKSPVRTCLDAAKTITGAEIPVDSGIGVCLLQYNKDWIANDPYNEKYWEKK